MSELTMYCEDECLVGQHGECKVFKVRLCKDAETLPAGEKRFNDELKRFTQDKAEINRLEYWIVAVHYGAMACHIAVQRDVFRIIRGILADHRPSADMWRVV